MGHRHKKSNNGDLPHLREEASQRLASLRRQLHEHAAPVMRVSPPNEETLFDHRLQPPQRCGGGNGSSDAQAGNRDAQLRDLGLEKVKQHIPGRVSEQRSSWKKRARSRRARIIERTSSDDTGGASAMAALSTVGRGLLGTLDNRASVDAMRLTSSLS